MFLILGLIFFALAGRLFSLQVLQRDWYRSQADRRLTRMPEVIPTRRGSILDRNGIELAKDSAAWDIGVYYPFITMRERFVARLADRWRTDPAHVRNRVAEMWRDLSEITGVSPTELQRRQTVIARRVVQIKRAVERRTRPGIVIAEETYGRRGSVAHAVVKDVDKRVMSIVGSQPERFFGLAVIETSKREFPYNDAACHVIGRLGRVFEEQFASRDNINEPYPVGHLKRYFLDDMIGQGGVEESREALLRGSRGIRQFGIERNLLKSIEPEPGRDVRLTIDIAFQMEVEGLLDEAEREADAEGEDSRISGAAVVIDLATGDILALASAPRYDPNSFNEDFEKLRHDKARPFVHRAIAGQYPAGSVFKAVCAIAGLHLGRIGPSTAMTCQGILDPQKPNQFRCFRKINHGSISIREAIKRSCNVFFYRLGRLVGRETLEKWSHKLGFGEKSGVELPGEAAGHVPGDPIRGGSRDWRDPRNLAVGQGTLLVTPLQVAQLYGIVATGGQLRRPHIVLSPREPRRRFKLGLNAAKMSALRDAFTAVVNEPGGTGFKNVKHEEITIAGKTGTAEAGRSRRTHAWFAGFAPADRPRIAFAVVIEHGGLGGSVAGPIAREIVIRAQAHGYLNGSSLITQR